MTADTTSQPASGPLTGLRVLDLTHALAGPYCTMLLADMGAEVLKVEPPHGGDPVRQMGPPFAGDDSVYFAAVNRGKRSVTLNLKDARGRDVVLELARDSDILVENYRPGVMSRLGLGYDAVRAVNPRLVYCSISGFGQTGRYRDRGGFDTIAQAMSGIMSATGHPGQPPAKAGVPVLDIGTGTLAAFGILSAIHARSRTGEGQWVDTSLFECGLAWSTWEAADYFAGAALPAPLGSAHRRNAPHQAFRAADGYLVVCADRPHFWTAFCALLGLPELEHDARFKTNADRLGNAALLAELVERRMTGDTVASWQARIEAAGIPCGPVLAYDAACEDPHAADRDMVIDLDHPRGGKTRTIGLPVKYSGTPPRPPATWPALGEDTDAVLLRAGLTSGDIERLRRDRVV